MEDKITDNVLKKIKDELIKEEPAGEGMENLTKTLANLKARNEILEKEVKTVRQSVNNWRKDSKNISEQILNTVNKDIDSRIEKFVKAKKDLNDPNEWDYHTKYQKGNL